MQQRWWIGVVAVLGIGLAILLVPRPDTGTDIPDADLSDRNKVDFDGDPEGSVRSPRSAERPRPVIKPDRIVQGPNPAAAALQAERDKPEAAIAGQLTAPWSGIRYALSGQGTDASKALADEINPLLADLRILRRDPARKPFSEIETQMTELEAKVLASEFAEIEGVVAGLERYRTLLEEHHTNMAGTPTPEEATPAPEEEQ